MNSDLGRFDLVYRDYDQAWQQLRHLEIVRTQYLSFFFTVVIGSIAVGVPLYRDGGAKLAASGSASAFVAAITTFSAVSYLVIARLGVQHRHYRRTISLIRNAEYDESLDSRLALHFTNESWARNALANQRMQEYVILCVGAIGLVVQLALALAIALRQGALLPLLVSLTMIFISASIVGAAIKFLASRHKKTLAGVPLIGPIDAS